MSKSQSTESEKETKDKAIQSVPNADQVVSQGDAADVGADVESVDAGKNVFHVAKAEGVRESVEVSQEEITDEQVPSIVEAKMNALATAATGTTEKIVKDSAPVQQKPDLESVPQSGSQQESNQAAEENASGLQDNSSGLADREMAA
ncbi:unnamed protein product, partial [Amoebophrya sp. A25]|eukprot:GSA25T00000116001.1